MPVARKGTVRQLLQWTFLWLHLLWVEAHRWLCDVLVRREMTSVQGSFDEKLVPNASEKERQKHTTHVVTFLGDDLAVGIGDWVPLGQTPGLPHYLKPFPAKGIFLRWRPMQVGSRGSRSIDWIPAADGGRNALSEKKTKNERNDEHGSNKGSSLLDLALADEVWVESTEVVVLSVGQNDFIETEPSVTASRVVLTCRTLIDRLPKLTSILVLVPPIPFAHQPKNALLTKDKEPDHHGDSLRARSDAIRRAVLDLSSSLPVAGGVKVTIGCDLAEELASSNYFRLEGRWISGSGYKEVARRLSEPLFLACKSAEASALRRLATEQQQSAVGK